ncbi:MAG: MerR family transcriptional regulator [Dehalococcoidia bacterium]
MAEKLTIGVVAQRIGVPVDTIRFYEAEGIIPAPARTAAGYRLYAATDLRRLRLVRRARLLGLSLPEIKTLVEQAFASDCGDYLDQLLERLAEQHTAVRRRIAELQALDAELGALAQHVRHAREQAPAGRRVVDCGFCPLIDEEDGHDEG